MIVGIDGSEAAVQAALWAADEAVAREVPLRLIAVTEARHQSADDYYDDVHRAEDAVYAARAAVEESGKPVEVETAIIDGPPGAALVSESDYAALLCVGSVGIRRFARSILGSTSIEVAENARCPVAIIRARSDEPTDTISWILVAANGTAEDRPILEMATREAKLRNAPVLIVGQRDDLESDADDLRRSNPGIRVYPVRDGADVAAFLKRQDEYVQLAVIGGSEIARLPAILGPQGRHRFRHAQSSVLVVRP
ncbi:universal stress protein [Mycolicibacterium flavescens]|uniref:universal stress protein n=1 Tax=Mycolicibacterium flavescens TaxID=1776 RepID=UPI0027E28C1A|nr:universal stress protein [Mycolicibacterium flavescens]